MAGNRELSLIITARTTIPMDTYAGVVSVDDILYTSGPCNVDHRGN